MAQKLFSNGPGVFGRAEQKETIDGLDRTSCDSLFHSEMVPGRFNVIKKLGKIGILDNMFHCKCMKMKFCFSFEFCQVTVAGDKLVPSIDSNFSDTVLCYWLNYNLFLQC